MIGEIIVFNGDDIVVVGHVRISTLVLLCSWDFCSFSFVDLGSRLRDSRNLDKNTSATSSEPNVPFRALN